MLVKEYAVKVQAGVTHTHMIHGHMLPHVTAIWPWVRRKNSKFENSIAEHSEHSIKVQRKLKQMTHSPDFNVDGAEIWSVCHRLNNWTTDRERDDYQNPPTDRPKLYILYITGRSAAAAASAWSAVRTFMRNSTYAISAYMPWPFRLSVCLSHGWISQKRLKLGSRNFHRTVAPPL